jgi:hypothetical protein
LELLEAATCYPTMGMEEVRQAEVGELVLVRGIVGVDVNV